MAMDGTGFEILVTPDILKQTAGEVSGYISTVERLFSSIQTTIGRTKYYWVGEAGDLHRKAFEEQADDVAEILVRLKEHPTDLLKIANIYEDTENTQAEASRQMSSNLID